MKYLITIRPIGTSTQKPIVRITEGFFDQIAFAKRIMDAAKPVYGLVLARDAEDIPGTLIVHNKEFGDIMRIEIDEAPEDDIPDAHLNGV